MAPLHKNILTLLGELVFWYSNKYKTLNPDTMAHSYFKKIVHNILTTFVWNVQTHRASVWSQTCRMSVAFMSPG